MMGSISVLEYFYMIIPALATFYLVFIYIIKPGSRRRPAPPSRPPPCPHPKLPIIGHLHLLLLTDEMPHIMFARLAKQLGPIFTLQLGQVQTLVISSPKLAEQVLKTHDQVMSNRPQLISAQYLSFGCSDVTFSPYGPYWRQARKICVTELLSPKRVSSFQLIRSQEANRMLSAVAAAASEAVDVSEMLFKLANDVLCRVAFGKRFIADEMRGLVKVLTETQALLAGFCVGDFFPSWEWVNSVSGMRRRLMKNLEDLRLVCDEIIHDHHHVNATKKQQGQEEHQEDFLDVLLRVQKRDDLDVPITDDNLKALVLYMVLQL
ncbi:OLC1v1023098C1 [Oldenlandia corymbosa var. corymbosa]|uniref:OLC1v1023098C1 n=1 Tax=Oldenlandia corymbosa var. corymbosa TaxID=529605 RepID=A0AAV1C259_OLDCO|nr:OLC1v1023098C1 [Oldenlandia corymbosa var. corymbosa]